MPRPPLDLSLLLSTFSSHPSPPSVFVPALDPLIPTVPSCCSVVLQAKARYSTRQPKKQGSRGGQTLAACVTSWVWEIKYEEKKHGAYRPGFFTHTHAHTYIHTLTLTRAARVNTFQVQATNCQITGQLHLFAIHRFGLVLRAITTRRASSSTVEASHESKRQRRRTRVCVCLSTTLSKIHDDRSVSSSLEQQPPSTTQQRHSIASGGLQHEPCKLQAGCDIGYSRL